jgi:hypothetical protein
VAPPASKWLAVPCRRVLLRILAGEFDAGFIATPCSSYSVRHDPARRSATLPEGSQPWPAGWQAYVTKHNMLAEFTASVIDTCRVAAIPVALENPADRADPSSPAHWPKFGKHGSLWRMRSIATALGAYHATYSTLAQCTLGASAQKWTTIAGAGGLARILASLRAERYLCPHGRDGHSEVLSGRDALGRSRTGEAAAYPEPLNALLTRALLAAATERRLQASSQHTGTSEPLPPLRPALPTIHEGRVGAGIAMGILAHASCESARHFPNRFAHSSLHIPETQASLRAEPFPGELSSPATSSRPASACKAHRRRRLPHSAPLPGAPDTSCDHIGCCPTPNPPIGPAHIAIANSM